MALQSMTGFARVEGANERARWIWEIRSVNGKGLDMRLRLPPAFEAMQIKMRNLVSKRIRRGNLQINLNIEHQDVQALPVVNQAALDAVLEIISRLQDRIDCQKPSAEQILRLKGVLELGEVSEGSENTEKMQEELLASFTDALTELEQARISEGQNIAQLLEGQIDGMEQLTKLIADDPTRTIVEIRKRLTRQVNELLEKASTLDADRLYQEAAMLATRSDLTEELDRLNVHFDSARQLLKGEGPVGRKLEFICQEFNRECNTICSKSNAVAVTNAGLDMKVIIDQFREQVQNLE